MKLGMPPYHHKSSVVASFGAPVISDRQHWRGIELYFEVLSRNSSVFK